MIQAYFGFKRLPFPKELKTEHMFESFDLRESIARLQILKQNRGLFCLTGEPGSGKTSVLRKFVEGLNPQTHMHAYTPHPQSIEVTCTVRSTLYSSFRHESERAICSIKLKGILELYDSQGKTPTIILDESHLMDHELFKS